MLIARIFEYLPLECPRCKSEMRVIAFITEREHIKKILTHIGEPEDPPQIAEARGPPGYDDIDQTPEYEVIDAHTVTDIEFDQTKSW